MTADTITLLRDAAQTGDWSNVPEMLRTAAVAMGTTVAGRRIDPSLADPGFRIEPTRQYSLIFIAALCGKLHKMPEKMIPPRYHFAWEVSFGIDELGPAPKPAHEEHSPTLSIS